MHPSVVERRSWSKFGASATSSILDSVGPSTSETVPFKLSLKAFNNDDENESSVRNEKSSAQAHQPPKTIYTKTYRSVGGTTNGYTPSSNQQSSEAIAPPPGKLFKKSLNSFYLLNKREWCIFL